MTDKPAMTIEEKAVEVAAAIMKFPRHPQYEDITTVEERDVFFKMLERAISIDIKNVLTEQDRQAYARGRRDGLGEAVNLVGTRAESKDQMARDLADAHSFVQAPKAQEAANELFYAVEAIRALIDKTPEKEPTT